MTSSMYKTFLLKDICLKIGSGSTPRGGSSVYKESGISFIRSQNIYNNYFEYNGIVHINDEAALKLKNVEVLKNDILLNITGDSVARCTIVPSSILPARVNQHVCIIRANSEIVDYRYLKYFFVNPYMQNKMLSLAQGGATRAALTKKMIEDFEIKLPPLEEQIRISNILSSLDKKIQLNNEMNKTLEVMAQALFKRWFVDFEFPNEEGKPYKSSGCKMIESEVGMVPNGWNICRLEDVANINPKESIKKGESKVFVEMANLPCNSARIIKSDYKEYKGGTKFRNGDILLARITPCLENGKTAIVDFLANNEIAFGSTEYIIMRPQYLNSYYLYCLARDEEFRSYAIKNMNGSSGRQRVDAKYIKEYTIVSPSKQILDKFYEICKSYFVQMKENDIESVALADVRDSLLPKLMN